MATRRKRIRLTLASMMVLIAALSSLFLVTVPLFRLGPPPCLTPIPIARWLITRPGVAHCADCHSRPRADVGLSTPESRLNGHGLAVVHIPESPVVLGGPAL